MKDQGKIRSSARQAVFSQHPVPGPRAGAGTKIRASAIRKQGRAPIRRAAAWLAACLVLACALTPAAAQSTSVSEPAGGDLPVDRTTTGYVVVGETVTGNIESTTDQDWYGVDLVGGRTYRFDLRGVSSGGGTMTDPYLMGIYDPKLQWSEGSHFSNTRTNDGGVGFDARLVFTATYTGRYIVSATGGGDPGYGEGTYALSVTDVTPAVSQDTDATREDASALTSGSGHNDTIGGTDRVDYFRFTLAGTNITRLTLGNLSKNADLFLENASGEVIEESIRQASQSERITHTLLPGTYYVRVAAQVVGETPYRLGLESRAATANELRQMYIAADADARRSGAAGLGDITGLQGARTEDHDINGGDDPIDYFRFTLRADRSVQLTLRGQEADADLFLEDGGGKVLARAETAGAVDETLSHTLKAGTYYVRVEARETGTNGYTLEYSVANPPKQVIAELDDLPKEVRTFLSTFIPAQEEDLIAVRQAHGGISEPEGRDFPDDNSTPGRVSNDGGRVTGTTDLASEDWDRFRVEFTGGTPYLIEAHGVETGRGAVHNTYLRIYDSSGNEDTSNVEKAGFQAYNRRIIFTPPGSGTAEYYISVGGSGAYNPNPSREVSNVPPGYISEYVLCVFNCRDDRSPGSNSHVVTYYIYPADMDHGGRYLKIKDKDGGIRFKFVPYLVIPPATYTLTVDLADGDDATVAVGHRHRGYFWEQDDTDTITVNLQAGKTYRAVLHLGFSATHAVFESILSTSSAPLPSNERALGSRLTDHTFTATHTEDHRFTISAQRFVSKWLGGTYTFRVDEVAAASETSGGDCADDYTTRCSLTPGTTVDGRIDRTGDLDWFALPGLDLDRNYSFAVTAGDGSDDLTDVQVRFYDRYALPASRQQGITRGVSFRPPTAGTYFLQIGSNGMGDSGTGPYTITMPDETPNTAPTASNSEVETVENTDYTFAAADFKYEDVDDDALASVTVTSLPASDKGTLKYDGTALTTTDLPQTVPATELGEGKLVYDPPVERLRRGLRELPVHGERRHRGGHHDDRRDGGPRLRGRHHHHVPHRGRRLRDGEHRSRRRSRLLGSDAGGRQDLPIRRQRRRHQRRNTAGPASGSVKFGGSH